MTRSLTYLTEKPARAALVATASILGLVLITQLLPTAEPAAVELAQVPPRPVLMPIIERAPPAPVAEPVLAPAASVAPAELASVVLRGVMGGGPGGGAAIFDGAGAAQRVVKTGREIVPGMILRSVGVHHAIVSSAAGDVRLELGRSGAVASAPSSLKAASTASGGQSAGPEAAQRETMQFRLGLEPVKSGGGFAGYKVRPGAQLPHLSAAGVQAGDLILSVNGSQLDEERLMELSWQIANSGSTEVEFSRGGKRYKKQLGMN